MSKPPFNSIGQALSFYNRCNPARLKPINLLEPEGRSTAKENDPTDIWASVTGAIFAVLMRAQSEERQAFYWRNVGDTEGQLAVEDIAKKLARSTQTVYRYLSRLDDDLEAELIRRGLLDFQQI